MTTGTTISHNSIAFERTRTFMACNQVNVSPILIINLLSYVKSGCIHILCIHILHIHILRIHILYFFSCYSYSVITDYINHLHWKFDYSKLGHKFPQVFISVNQIILLSIRRKNLQSEKQSIHTSEFMITNIKIKVQCKYKDTLHIVNNPHFKQFRFLIKHTISAYLQPISASH